MAKKAARTNSVIVLALFLMSSPVTHAAPIEAGSEKSVSQNKLLLNSVIKFRMGSFFNSGICSSTLISKNVLLTALHCVEGMHSGDMINLNDNPNYRAVEIIAQKGMSALVNDESVSTDIALILFKADRCEQSTLGEVDPIPLATQKNKAQLSNRVLLAGYGETQFGLGNAGTLHAGYNHWMLSDYSQVKYPELIPGIKEHLKNVMETAQNQLVLGGGRTEVAWFTNIAGKKISGELGAGTVIEHESAVDLPGDSGGPAFAFDKSGNPFIVGVTSEVSSNARPKVAQLLARGPKNELITKVTVPMTENGLDVASNQLHSVLLKLKVIDSSNYALMDFKVVQIRDRLAYGMYASTSNPINDRFILGNLKKFEGIRDQSKNFCQ